ncbi:probable deoxyhypusine synthase isoform X2 [Ixodes scapularis]|uniref:probable deoxyhypusine synthase isoform X2 n=1 Tax=Ixodes scapularis TaxID=6945 RepID=UPI001A9F7D36|nr:probable deoxyhypusine synthase isoform X2 [Ixodes scapularis]
MSAEGEPAIATESVLRRSGELPTEEKVEVEGYDFNQGIDYERILQSYRCCGFQATHFDRAVTEINRMVDCIVTTAGGVEEDLIKCLAPTYVGDFSLRGGPLRDLGINRIGNLLAPNDNYCLFENWIIPVLNKMLDEQRSRGTVWSPSKMIERFGLEIDDPRSIYYWAARNKIPVFCPALTDGSLGDMIYFHSFRNPGLVVDIAQDIRRLNTMAVKAVKSGMVIVGGGVVKHHICNSNMMRNGADFAVYLNTGSEFDGSDSGASPDEAVSWGKIRKDAHPVKVCAEATLVLPLLVAETFAKWHFAKRNAVK